jgi:hypothetical protein
VDRTTASWLHRSRTAESDLRPPSCCTERRSSDTCARRRYRPARTKTSEIGPSRAGCRPRPFPSRAMILPSVQARTKIGPAASSDPETQTGIVPDSRQ